MGACLAYPGYAMPPQSTGSKHPNNLTEPGPWEVMYQSHQALFHLLDQVASMTLSLKRDRYDEIRAKCNVLFGLLKLHARVEDAVFFPSVEKKFPGIATSYADDHKRSAEGRPKLLEALDKAKESDELFEDGMSAMRKFCEGNKNHQLGEEKVINPNLPSFSLEEQKQIVRAMAELDQESWNTTYCQGIFAHINDEKRMKFLKGLKQSISNSQFTIIMQNIRYLIESESEKLVIPVMNRSQFLNNNF